MDFLLLGPLEVVRGGVPLLVGQRRAERCLLGLLLLEVGRMVPKDRLIDLLWDGDPPGNAHAILQTHVSRLRSVLDHDRDGRDGVRLRGRNSGYVLETDPDTVDAFRFRGAVVRAESMIDATARAQTLRDALALWRGSVLADVATDRLRDRVGTGLAELRLHAWEVCMQAELERGRHREIIPELHELVTAHPMRERLVGCLMLALYRDGRQAAALDVFNAVRDRLVEHTGLDPSTDLVQLRDAIIRREPIPAAVTSASAQVASHQERTAERFKQRLHGATRQPRSGMWFAVAEVDREYFQYICETGDAVAGSMTFPRFHHERRFPLRGDRMLIGRRSVSRGINPEIDLAGPPEDTAIGRSHAMLVCRMNGEWSVVDLRSTNGTYFNDFRGAALNPHEETPLSHEDRLYLGAWTRLTIRLEI